MSEPATRQDDDLLVALQVREEFGGLLAVNDLDFIIPQRSIVSLIGPNGAGKTTFFNMLTGLYKPTSGVVIFDGQDVTAKPPHAITKAGIGRTFQNMTAIENVLVGMHSRLKGGIVRSILRTPALKREEEQARERARPESRRCACSGPTAPARRRSSTCSPGCTSRPRAGSRSTGTTSPACAPT